MDPYYADDAVTIYHGDCRDVLPDIEYDCIATDPPYPNNAGHFTESVASAGAVLRAWATDALIFWTELERPPVAAPLVAVHIWHRANVNGRPYEPIYQFARDGEKRRSEVLRHAVEFENATGADYLGHPTQKPVALMSRLLAKLDGVVLDPFAGVGSTLRAAKDLGRKAIGIEIEERYCEIAAKRCAQEVLDLAAA
jgi:DNA modification methylase